MPSPTVAPSPMLAQPAYGYPQAPTSPPPAWAGGQPYEAPSAATAPLGIQPPAMVAAAAPKTAISGTKLLAGIVVVALIAAGGYYFVNNSGHKPGASAVPFASGSRASAPGSLSSLGTQGPIGPIAGAIVVLPAVVDCTDAAASATMTIVLPARVKGTDEVTAEVDGETQGTSAVSDVFTQRPDGSWLETETQSVGDLCGQLSAGPHVMRVLDANGTVLAQGGFTIEGAALTPTPALVGTVVVDPGTFSCSDGSTTVTMTITLSALVSGDQQVTAELDGSKTLFNDSVSSGFVQQSDGTWLSSGSETAAEMCSTFPVGHHVLTVVDAGGNVLAEGSFTVTE